MGPQAQSVQEKNTKLPDYCNIDHYRHICQYFSRSCKIIMGIKSQILMKKMIFGPRPRRNGH